MRIGMDVGSTTLKCVAIDDEKIAVELKQSKWLSILLWVIGALLIIIAISLIIWFSLTPDSLVKAQPNNSQFLSETEIEWNTEHTEKF